MKKYLLLFLCIFSFLLVGCNIKQQFPINYDYNTFNEFKNSLENLKYSESEEYYNRYYLFFDLDKIDYSSSFRFFGANYGTERNESTISNPIVSNMPLHFIQIVKINDEMEIKCESGQFSFLSNSNIDITKLIITEDETFTRVKYDEINVISIKGKNNLIRKFVEDNINNIVIVEVGKNNNPIHK